jgi:hypothetical protein
VASACRMPCRFSSSDPSTAAGSETPQCAVMADPASRDMSRRPRCRTREYEIHLRCIGLGELVPDFERNPAVSILLCSSSSRAY